MDETRLMDLCGGCQAVLRARNIVKVVESRRNGKVTCELCGLRRYGGKYSITPLPEKK